MNQFLILAAAAAEPVGQGTIEQIKHQFGWNMSGFIAQVITFVIVAVALKRFAYGPLLKVLDDRKQRIAEGLANADKIKIELANAQAKTQELLTQASNQANKIIEEARAAAAKVTETETQKAVAAAQDIINKARQSNEAELARIKTELRREVGRLVATTTAKVTGKVLTNEDQQRLIEEANRQVAA